MNWKRISGMMLVLLLANLLLVMLDVSVVLASGTIYIRADGTVDPSTAPIQRTGGIYTFTGNISDSIVIEKDNIVVDGAGCTLQGPGSGNGLTLTGRSNVRIKNMEIKAFNSGIYLYSSSHNSISGNNIANNLFGICLYSSSNNSIYHNNFVSNTQQILTVNSVNVWDDGYPSGGNYWSNYVGMDKKSGPYQNITYSRDGIGDTPYVIDGSNQDNYPFMEKYWLPFENQAIYIRADGSIDPSEAPIQRRGDTYTLTANITSNNYGIVIERSNIIVDGDGYTLQGSTTAKSKGISNNMYRYALNITIRNMEIKMFDSGIYLIGSGNDSISGNTFTENGVDILLAVVNSKIAGNNITANNGRGIALVWEAEGNTISGNTIANGDIVFGIYLGEWCSNNVVSKNIITDAGWAIYVTDSSDNAISGNAITNSGCGVFCEGDWSVNNTISGNIITNASWRAIEIDGSSGNSISGNNIRGSGMNEGIYLMRGANDNNISGNTIADNKYGIYVRSSSGNRIYHNSFENNTEQVNSDASINVWDDGYPSGGNYWSNYRNGTDLYSGPYQNETGSDGIGDIPYVINANNQDRYPKIKATEAGFNWTLVAIIVAIAAVGAVTGAFFLLQMRKRRPTALPKIPPPPPPGT